MRGKVEVDMLWCDVGGFKVSMIDVVRCGLWWATKTSCVWSPVWVCKSLQWVTKSVGVACTECFIFPVAIKQPRESFELGLIAGKERSISER